MFRAPTWTMSAYSATRSTWAGSITSVTTGRPVRSRASASSRRPSRPRPWNEYGLVRGLNAPPRRTRAPAAATAVGRLEQLLARLDGARPGHDRERAVPDPHAADVHDRVLGVELPRRELERSTDRRHGFHPRQRREAAHEDLLAGADLSERGDHHPLDAPILVRGESFGEDVALHAVDLVFRGGGRHHDEHRSSVPPVRGRTKKKAEVVHLCSPGTAREPGPRPGVGHAGRR